MFFLLFSSVCALFHIHIFCHKYQLSLPISTLKSRQLVTVFNGEGKCKQQLALPDAFLSPIRSDIIHFVHTNMAKNKRQPYSVMNNNGPSGIVAGHQHSAHS